MELQAPDGQQRRWFAALDHARLTGAKPTYNIFGDYYTVRSPRTGRIYVLEAWVTERFRHIGCSCPAYHAGKICWHRALVMALPYERDMRVKRVAGAL